MVPLLPIINNTGYAVPISWAIIKYKIDSEIEEVIRLYVLPMFTFITYYEPSPKFVKGGGQ